MKVNQYQFDNICRQMEKEFGKVRKGEENQYLYFLFPIESNLMKTHRRFPASNSRRLLEAIPLALFCLKRNMSGEDYELDRFWSEDNERLVHAILMAVDPLTNEELAAVFQENGVKDLNDREMLKDIYTIAIMCILRIKESVELFVQQLGSNGYFDFLESTIGMELPQNDEYDFSVMLPKNCVIEQEPEPEDNIQEDVVQTEKKRNIFSRLFKSRS